MAEPDPLAWAHPLVQAWFRETFGTPTEPQVAGWPAILAGQSTLISAPTGSGKTLTAFLVCIDRLVRAAVDGTLADQTQVVYISPLKALGNDIQRNLEGPLAGIVALARRQGVNLPEIRTAVRTGDTLAHQRQAMVRRPPHILVTTPESLYILLTAEKSRAILRDVSTVIVDEIHAMADDKRGSHLALSLERLEALTGQPLTRIGLSATQKPIALVAAFLGGEGRPAPTLVQVPPRRELDLAVEVPASELGPVASKEMWAEIYDRIAALALEHRSTLVFVNTRRLAERVAHHLAERLGADQVTAHHGSLARRIRLEAERRLKHGELRALVATASLELGIDIGTVDLVCQINSPRSIGVAVQRIGRAGHWRGATPKGRLFATTRDDLVECAALVRAIRAGDLDRLVVPEAPLDILSQQIVAMCAADDWHEDLLYATIRRAYPYRALERADFDEVVAMLSEGIAARRGRHAAYLHRDSVHGRLRGRRGARLAALTNGGAIPETGLYTVVAEPEGTVVGTVDEDFAVESMAGDIILLGSTSWRVRRVTSAGRLIVEDAHGAAPSVPFWRGEAPGRTPELSAYVGDLMAEVSGLAPDARPGDAVAPAGSPTTAAAIEWAGTTCGLDRAGAEQLVDYVVTGRAVLGDVPSSRTVIAERFFDEGGGMQLVLHAPFGARLNRAWGLALRKRFCRSFNFELQAAATDNAVNISLAEQHSFPLADVFAFLRSGTVREVLEQAALASPLFATRWRWDAGRALALLRFRGGRKLPINLLRLLSDDLLAAVFPDVAACQENIEGDIQIPDHPLVREVMRDVLTEAMDLEGLMALLDAMAAGTVRLLAVDTPVPSVFSHEVLNANPYAYLDDAPLEERRARAVELRRTLPDSVLSEIGALDPAAIDEVCAQAWPDVRDVDELHDVLLTLVAVPRITDGSAATPRDDDTAIAGGDTDSPLARRVAASIADWAPLFEALVADGRATRAWVDRRGYWLAVERRSAVAALWPGARFADGPQAQDPPAALAPGSLAALTQGWMGHAGPITVTELSTLLGLASADVESAVLRLEVSGWALRGHFRRRRPRVAVRGVDEPGAGTGDALAALEWCERRLLARIHRLTLGTLRREIAPVSAADFMRWLLDWQHVTPGTQAHGEAGTFEVLRQLQGFEAPANAWESQVLPRRIGAYDAADLDRLCLSGAIGWGRLSPHPATAAAPEDARARRVVPTSVAPVTFFVREDADWMGLRRETPREPPTLSLAATTVLDHLRGHGASFFAELARGTGRLKSEVEEGLWELVTAGLVTADGFDNLRALIDPRRRAGSGSGRTQRPRDASGRWALLPSAAGVDRPTAIESACWMLLRRYGVVFRDLLARESNLPPWRDLLITYRRLEDRGEVRGGRFVSGFIGEQFALPVAVESLRALRHRPPADDIVTLSGTDPLNLIGILVPGDRVAAVTGRTVSFKNGVPVALDPDEAAYRLNAVGARVRTC